MHSACIGGGRPVPASPTRRANGRGRYCSRSCMARSRVGRFSPRWTHGRYVRSRVRCVRCGEWFVGRASRRFCSAACAKRPVTMPTCAQCGERFRAARLAQRFCSAACKIRAQTTGRRTIRRTVRKARSAQSLVRYHVQAGNIVHPEVCEECGASDRRIEAAHFDYDDPLRVRWLCRSCHVRWDKQHPKGGTVVVTRNALAGETPATSIAGEGVA